MNFSGIPLARAMARLYITATIPFLKTKRNIKITAHITARKNVSLTLMVSMLPHIKESASEVPPEASLEALLLSFAINKKAMPSIKENKIPVEIFGEKFPFSATGPIKNDAITHRKSAASTGFIPKKRPIIAPAKAVCAIATPTNGMFKRYTQTPIIPQAKPAKTDAINALTKK